MKIRELAALAAAAAAITLPLATQAQYGGNVQNRGGNTGRRAPSANYITELRTIADTMAKQYQVRVVVDPMLAVPTKPVAPSTNLAVAQAMDALAAQVKGSAWRRVYLPQTQANVPPPPEKLANSVRALEMLEQGGMVIEDPASKRATSFLKGFPTSQTFVDDLAAQSFGKVPVYVLFSTNPLMGAANDPNRTPEERMMDLQRQQMALMQQMTPEQMGQAMQQGMQMFMNMDPAVRQQFMGNMMRAGMQMFMNMPADQRQELINQAMQGAQQMFGPGGPGAPGGPGGPPRGPGR